MFRLVFATLWGLALSEPNAKIDGQLLQALDANNVANIVLTFAETSAIIDNVNNKKFSSQSEKTTALKTQLEEHRLSTQQNALTFLGVLGVPFQSLWITNGIYMSGVDANLVNQLALIEGVDNIREQIEIPVPSPTPGSDNGANDQWGIKMIEAPPVWNGGIKGKNVVVSSIDTGVRPTHEALKNNFRTPYGWYDPTLKSATPMDTDGHGTHTMGTICGTNGIGVAPEAVWITCRGCSSATCTEADLTACGQWITCPTLPDGSSSDCKKTPNLVSNSWGGGQGSSFYNSVISAWRTAGIIPIFSQGNSGPNCGSANSPADSPQVIAVGSTTAADGISSFSSRGSAVTGVPKPDVCETNMTPPTVQTTAFIAFGTHTIGATCIAPGSDIRSSWHTTDSSYNTISGTSMACPHVAGTVALMLSQNPTLTYDKVKQIMQNNADNNTLSEDKTCGGSMNFPNNHYGYGRINARKYVA